MAKKRSERKVPKRTVATPARNPKYETLHDLMILKLRSLYDVEREIIKALPKFAKAASNEKLREAFAEHLEETREHAERLEQIFELLNIPAKPERVEAVRGLAKDAEWIIKSVKNPAARDAVLIAAAQYVEHYEMAGYGSARAWADVMRHAEVSGLLQQTLDEEGNANKKLTTLAEQEVNEHVESGMDGESAR